MVKEPNRWLRWINGNAGTRVGVHDRILVLGECWNIYSSPRYVQGYPKGTKGCTGKSLVPTLY